MIISLNAIKQFVDIDVSVDKLVDLIGSRLVEIEEVIDLGKKYAGIYIAKVIKVDKLDNSDHLSSVLIDDARKNKDVERNADGFIQVVCGALNVKEGMFVAWLTPGSCVPETFDSDKPIKIEHRDIHGVKSNGMLASAKELALFDEHDGILEFDETNEPGTDFAKAYDLDDYLLDIENKSLTHRPDCFGVIGFAREVAAILGKEFTSPDWFLNLNPKFDSSNQFEINVAILDYELSDRYQAIVMSNVDGSKKSSLKIQTYLSRVGVKPINAIVDATNYLMIMTGQPLHAFDYDKLVSLSGDKVEILVRAGREGEKLKLLDGKEIELSNQDIVISAGDIAVALAGAMGGLSTVIDENTKNIVIESATFNLYNLRSTQMRHGIYSDAITRFTKGQPADLTAPVLHRAVELLKDWIGASVVSELNNYYANKKDLKHIKVPQIQINDTLGTDWGMTKLVEPLSCAEFDITVVAPYTLDVKTPWWRSDINTPEDIIEEIGRINGFDNIEAVLPKRDFEAIFPTHFDRFRDILRKKLVRTGVNEVLTYSFIHGDMMKKAGLDPENSYKIENSISPDLQYYRQSIMPSLLNLVHPNIKQGYDSFALFELGKTHQKLDGLIESEKVPFEYDKLGFVVANKNNVSDSPYYLAKKYFDYLADSFGLDLEYKPIDQQCNNPTMYPFEYKRSCEVHDKKSRLMIGIIGEFKKSVTKNFKLPEYCSGFEIFVNNLFDSAGQTSNVTINYKLLSRFQFTERDICFQVDSNMQYGTLISSVNKALEPIKLEAQITPIDIYQSEDSKTKNITIRIKLTSHKHTLTGEEVSNAVDSITSLVTTDTGAKII